MDFTGLKGVEFMRSTMLLGDYFMGE